MENIDLTRIEKSKSLGVGRQAEVFQCKLADNQQEFALSIIRQRLTDEQVKFLNEIKSSSSQYFVRIYHLDITQNYSQILMELGREDLKSFMNKIEYQNLSIVQKTKYFLQMTNAVIELHNLNKIHRDLKPENFICFGNINDEQIIKLSDFDVSKDIEFQQASSLQGTEFYIAPEMNEQLYGKSVDVWSLGVIWFIMMTNYKIDRKYILRNFSQDEIDKIIILYQFPQEYQRILKKMLQKDPQHRLKLQSVKFNIENILHQSNQLKNYTFILKKEIQQKNQKIYFDGEIAENLNYVTIQKVSIIPNVKKIQLLEILQQQQFKNVVNIIGFKNEQNTFYLVKEKYGIDFQIENFQDNNLKIEIFTQIVKILEEIHRFHLIIGNLSFKDFTYYPKFNAIKLKKIKLKRLLISKKDYLYLGQGINSAPEISTKLFDAKADIWSMGIVLYQLLAGVTINDNHYFKRPDQDIQTTINNKILQLSVDKFLQELLTSMLKINPQERQSLTSISSLLQNYKMPKIQNVLLNVNKIPGNQFSSKGLSPSIDLNKFKILNEFIRKINSLSIFKIIFYHPQLEEYIEQSKQKVSIIQNLLLLHKQYQQQFLQRNSNQFDIFGLQAQQDQIIKDIQDLYPLELQLNKILQEQLVEKTVQLEKNIQEINNIIFKLNGVKVDDRAIHKFRLIFQQIAERYRNFEQIKENQALIDQQIAPQQYLRRIQQIEYVSYDIQQSIKLFESHFEQLRKNLINQHNLIIASINLNQEKLQQSKQADKSSFQFLDELKMQSQQIKANLEIQKTQDLRDKLSNLIDEINLQRQNEINNQLMQFQQEIQKNENKIDEFKQFFELINQYTAQFEEIFKQSPTISNLILRRNDNQLDQKQQVMDGQSIINQINAQSIQNGQELLKQSPDKCKSNNLQQKKKIKIVQEKTQEQFNNDMKNFISKLNKCIFNFYSQLIYFSDLIDAEDVLILIQILTQNLQFTEYIVGDKFKRNLEELIDNFVTIETKFLEKYKMINEKKKYDNQVISNVIQLKKKLEDMIINFQNKNEELFKKIENFLFNIQDENLQMTVYELRLKLQKKEKEMQELLDQITPQDQISETQLNEFIHKHSVFEDNLQIDETNFFENLQRDTLEIQYIKLITYNLNIEQSIKKLYNSIEEYDKTKQKYQDLQSQIQEEIQQLNQIRDQCQYNLELHKDKDIFKNTPINLFNQLNKEYQNCMDSFNQNYQQFAKFYGFVQQRIKYMNFQFLQKEFIQNIMQIDNQYNQLNRMIQELENNIIEKEINSEEALKQQINDIKLNLKYSVKEKIDQSLKHFQENQNKNRILLKKQHIIILLCKQYHCKRYYTRMAKKAKTVYSQRQNQTKFIDELEQNQKNLQEQLDSDLQLTNENEEEYLKMKQILDDEINKNVNELRIKNQVKFRGRIKNQIIVNKLLQLNQFYEFNYLKALKIQQGQ